MAARKTGKFQIATLSALLAVVTVPTFSHAQDARNYNPVSRTDAYGNAEAYYQERRSLSNVYQNDVQQRMLAGPQWYGRRGNNRGGLVPFTLNSDFGLTSLPGLQQFGNMQGARALGYELPDPLAGSASIPGSMRKAFQTYGGFDSTPNANRPMDFHSLINRPVYMMQAIGLNAPVYRARSRIGLSGGLPIAIEGSGPGSNLQLGSRITRATLPPRATDSPSVLGEGQDKLEPPDPAVRPRTVNALNPAQAETPAPDAPKLDEALSVQVRALRSHLHRQAWEHFAVGDYRSAATRFEAASVADQSDREARIGEIFCYIALDSMRTTLTLLDGLAERGLNPFRADLDFSERFESLEALRSVRSDAQLFLQTNPDLENARALYALTIWYLGDREEAQLAAAALARSDGPYATWPMHMRAAESMSPADKGN